MGPDYGDYLLILVVFLYIILPVLLLILNLIFRNRPNGQRIHTICLWVLGIGSLYGIGLIIAGRGESEPAMFGDFSALLYFIAFGVTIAKKPKNISTSEISDDEKI